MHITTTYFQVKWRKTTTYYYICVKVTFRGLFQNRTHLERKKKSNEKKWVKCVPSQHFIGTTKKQQWFEWLIMSYKLIILYYDYYI